MLTFFKSQFIQKYEFMKLISLGMPANSNVKSSTEHSDFILG